MKTREGLHVYVVDRDATILFASRAVIDVQSHDVLQRTFRAAIAAAAQAGDTSPLMFEGQLVRVQRLATSGGSESYAVFIERVAAAPKFSGTVAEEIDGSAESA